MTALPDDRRDGAEPGRCRQPNEPAKDRTKGRRRIRRRRRKDAGSSSEEKKSVGENPFPASRRLRYVALAVLILSQSASSLNFGARFLAGGGRAQRDVSRLSTTTNSAEFFVNIPE